MSQPKLKIGLLLDGDFVSSWALEMLEIIRASNHSEIILLIMPRPRGSANKKSLFRKLVDNLDGIGSTVTRRLLDWYYRKLLERQTYGRHSELVVQSPEIFKGIATILVDPIQTKWSDSFGEADLRDIRTHQVDVFIRLGFRILRGGILGAARYGVWSYHHGDNLINRGGPAGFWEVMESWPETGSVLQILTEDLDNGKILSRTYSSTNFSSVLDNRRNYFWKTLSLIPRKLSELHKFGASEFFKRVDEQNSAPVLYSHKLYTNPDNKEYALLLIRKTLQKFKEVHRNKLYLDQWILLYDIRKSLSSSLWRYKRIVPPKDRFWADPHIIERDDFYYIFIEELLYKDNKGHISVIKMGKDGVYTPPQKVLERPYHLSYPFVFDFDGELYMIPETAQNKTIELYRCVDFPGRWEFVHCLMEGVRAYDATVQFHNGKWWLFTNMVEVSGASSWDELFLFSADNPLSQTWVPHDNNPIISDCKQARPAGRLIEYNGHLYRPSQNCAGKYGFGFNLAKVVRLDDQAYAEEVVTRVTPNWSHDLVATHTFSRCGDLHVIDAQLRRRRHG
ncbi:MAG: hypothetical protein KGN37_09590 [Burkholderiales bacterium]|nr:hypothetical protein [Burkholderiales bacterium]